MYRQAKIIYTKQLKTRIMNHTIYQTVIAIGALLLTAFAANAQEKEPTEINIDNVKITITDSGDTVKKKKTTRSHSLEIGTSGIVYNRDSQKKKKKHKKLHVGMHFDFGINNFIDNTNYNALASQDVVMVNDSTSRPLSAGDLTLRNGASRNFNIWPVWLK